METTTMILAALLVAASAQAQSASDSAFYAIRQQKIDSFQNTYSHRMLFDDNYRNFIQDSCRIDRRYDYYEHMRLITYFESDPRGFVLHNGDGEFRKNTWAYDDWPEKGDISPIINGSFEDKLSQAKEYIAFLHSRIALRDKEMQYRQMLYAEQIRRRQAMNK